MITYGGVKSISAARFGSIAMNATSHAPCDSASNTLPAASKVTKAWGKASLCASSRAMSADTPRGSPDAGSFCARTGFP
jgi:hypothetical protein